MRKTKPAKNVTPLSPIRDAWMDGARAGVELAFNLILRDVVHMARYYGIKLDPSIVFSPKHSHRKSDR